MNTKEKHKCHDCDECAFGEWFEVAPAQYYEPVEGPNHLIFLCNSCIHLITSMVLPSEIVEKGKGW